MDSWSPAAPDELSVAFADEESPKTNAPPCRAGGAPDLPGVAMMVEVRTTRVSRIISAARAQVYDALLDADALAKWKVPTGMTCRVETFEPREGGRLRVSLTYESPTGVGKTSARTDTYDGRFVELVPDERVVEIDEFETDQPSLQGQMRVTISLADVDDGGTEVVGLHEGVPPGIALSDNQLGWESALSRLAALVEADAQPRQRAKPPAQ